MVRMSKPWVAVLLLCWNLAADRSAVAAGGSPAKFRDFKIYATSAPDPADAGRIVATVNLLNGGSSPFNVRISLAENKAAGFEGKTFEGRIEAGNEASWQFDLTPPEGLSYEVLKGVISFDEGGAPERELHVAVQGQDSAEFSDARVQKITARAQVVGTHAPRTVESIRSMSDAIKQKRSTEEPRLVLASDASSDYKIEFDSLVAKPGAQQLTLEEFQSAPGRAAAEVELAEAVLDLQKCVARKTGVTLSVVPALSLIHI